MDVQVMGGNFNCLITPGIIILVRLDFSNAFCIVGYSTSNTFTVLYTHKLRTCNTVSPLHCIASRFTYTLTVYLFNEHFVTFCKFSVNV